MRWKGGRANSNIEDRRGMKTKAAAGGGIGAIVIALIAIFVFKQPPDKAMQMGSQLSSQFGGAGSSEQQQGERGTPEDRAGLFVDVIGTNVNEVWAREMRGYEKPLTVLYTQGTNTGCGFGKAAMGPFYCPADNTIYLDLGFWQVMEDQLGASGADFARAYVIAHEFGHHVQTLEGTSAKVHQIRRSAGGSPKANQYQVAMELQADCYAGVWAANAEDVSGGNIFIEAGDLREGLKTASAIGDDTLQKRAGQRVSPESFTHGSSEQRMEWLNRGFEAGNPSACDTFRALGLTL